MAWTETINFANDTMDNRSRDAFVSAYGWSATLPDGSANPETKKQFRSRMVKQYMKEVTRSEEAKALQTAIVPPVVQD